MSSRARQHLLFIGVIVLVILMALSFGGAGRARARPLMASAGDIVINEIIQNPDAVADDSGEWFELANTTASNIDIEGWCVLDKDTDYFTISSSLVITASTNPDHYVVLGVNDDSGTNGGLTVDYEYICGSGAGKMWLANGADEIVLVEPNVGQSCGSWNNLQTGNWLGTVIDGVDYDGGTSFPNPTGKSMAFRRPSTGQTTPEQENDSGSNWYQSTIAYGDGDKGTPGAKNTDAPNAIVLANLVATSQVSWLRRAVLLGLFAVAVVGLSVLVICRRV